MADPVEKNHKNVGLFLSHTVAATDTGSATFPRNSHRSPIVGTVSIPTEGWFCTPFYNATTVFSRSVVAVEVFYISTCIVSVG